MCSRSRTLVLFLGLAFLFALGPAVTIQAAGPDMALDKPALAFGALTSGATFTKQTSAQIVRLTQTGTGTVTWTATSAQPWLQVSPASGTGSALLTVSVSPAGGVPATGTLTGSVVLSYSGASTSSGVVNVTLRLIPNGTSSPAFGFVDTPVENASGLAGAVPFTGWAIDDVGIAAVSLCRAAVAGEVAPVDGRCGGYAEIYVGDAVFIEGARSDLAAAYPTYPRNTQAGWGLMVLTNQLPNQGNGTYVFFMWARDVEGTSTLIGTRTFSCDNAHATKPFGTIDTPAQGETISGTPYVNFGWALTQNPKIITKDFVNMLTYIDGEPLGQIEYGFNRPDVAAVFPGLMNSDGAGGYRILETTKMTNGLHTIVWVATDSGGFVEGLGSRYFNVSNGEGAPPAAATRRTDAATAASAPPPPPSDAATIDALPLDPASISARRGWAADTPLRALVPDASGRVVLGGEELDRFELWLGGSTSGRYSGYVRAGGALAPLPIGSRLDAQTGKFTWGPSVGFVGTYDLVFVRSTDGRAEARQEVRIVLRPKGSGQHGPQVVIDTPSAQQDVGQPFSLGGWAADLDAEDGTGIDTLHVWAYPLNGGSPVFLGVASGKGYRPDVAAVYGDQFQNAGFGLTVQGLTPGNYDLAVFAWSRVRGGFVPATVVRITVR